MNVRGSPIRLISIIVMVILVFSVFTLALQIREGLSAPIVVMQDTTTSTGWGVYSTRPVLAEYVSGSSALVGQQIDSITVNLKKSSSTASGTAQVGIINPDLSMKKVFATFDISTLSSTSYPPIEFNLPSGDSYTIQAGDRIGVKYTGLNGNHVSIQRDTSSADPFDGANTYLSYYTSSWTAETTYDLTMTLKLVNGPSGGSSPSVSVSHSPTNPTSSQTVTFTASATDNDVGLSSIQIFVNGASIGSCTVSGTSANCIKPGGPYTEGSTNSYYATATNMLGQIGTSSTGTFYVTPSSGTGTFVDTEFEGGLDEPTSMAFAPDGRLFVAEKGGDLRVIKNGVLQSAPFLTVPVDTDGERGLIGIAFDPNFQTNKFVYIQYTTSTSPIHNKVSRFTASTANPDVAAAGSATTIIDLDDLDGAYHNAGAIHFGPDGKLYVAAGDNGHSSDAQVIDNRLGKILRINADGTIPSDNPFFNTANAEKEIWAYGLRNPFTFAFRPGTSTMNINDVGQDTWEEINRGASGANFGWPTCEGTCSNPAFTNPIYTYQHPTSGSGRSVAGGAFYEAGQFPVEYRGNYFFGDYVANFIKRLTPTNQVIDFLTNAETPVDIDVGPDGSLYYLSYQGGSVHKVQYVTTGGNGFPTALAAANPTSGASPLTVNFGGSGSSDPDGDSLTYSWNFGDGTPNGSGVSVAHTYNSPGGYTATLTVNDGEGGTDTDNISITVGTPPQGTIINPPAGTKYDAGDIISYSGSGTDAQDGTLPASAFNWEILLHHNTHTHPFQEFNGVTSGSFTLPQQSETSDDVWYRIYLTVTDSTGLQNQTTRDLNPNKVTMTLASNVPGLTVNLDGVPKTTPSSVVGVVGISRALQAPLSQSLNGQTYQFDSWSDGGAATHNIFTPDVDTTFTANYVLTAGPVIHMQDTTENSGWGIYSTRPVLSEFVSSSSTLVGKQIDSITVNLKKSSTTATGTAQVGIINSDLSMKKLFATIDIGALPTSYTPIEYTLPAGDSYTIQTGDRIGVKNTGGTSSSNYVSIMRDTTTSDPFDAANTYLSYYTTSWTAQTTYDLTMTLKSTGSGGTTNTPPVSNAGIDQSVNEGSLVTLTGLASSDPDNNTPLTYSWSQTGGSPTVTLSSDTAAQPTFTAPSVSATTVLTFSLVVTDSLGLADPTADTAQVTVNDVPPGNTPPVSNAGPDQIVNENVLVTLTGLGSTDPGGSVASYAWSQTGGPAATLSSATAAQPTFTAPSVTDTTVLTFSLVVTDNQGLADPTPDTMTVTVNDVPGGQPPGTVMQDTTTSTGWGIYSTRPVLSEFVSSSSTLVGKQIDSITVNIKKGTSTSTGTAEIGIINSDLSMKKLFANIDISTLTTSYAPNEFLLPSGDNYTIQVGDRIGIKYTGGSSSANYISIMRDTNTADPYDGANTYLSYYTTSWNAQTTYDLVMTLKLLS